MQKLLRLEAEHAELVHQGVMTESTQNLAIHCILVESLANVGWHAQRAQKREDVVAAPLLQRLRCRYCFRVG